MGDHYKAVSALTQSSFQPRYRLNIKVVGRFIQEHQFGIFCHQLGQSRASPLTTRGGFHRAIWVKLQPFCGNFNLIVLSDVQRRKGKVSQSFKL